REPVITSFHSSMSGGTRVAQAVAGIPEADAATTAAAPNAAAIVGLSDTPERLALLGLVNPGEAPASYRLVVYDSEGNRLAGSAPLTLAAHSQRQLQAKEIARAFGVAGEQDYRVEVERVSGAGLVPYASH